MAASAAGLAWEGAGLDAMLPGWNGVTAGRVCCTEQGLLPWGWAHSTLVTQVQAHCVTVLEYLKPFIHTACLFIIL